MNSQNPRNRKSGQPLGPRQVGQIVLRGPSIMTEYYQDEAATTEALQNGWLQTGDLGYLVDGDLHVCGRMKDLIIISGKNVPWPRKPTRC